MAESSKSPADNASNTQPSTGRDPGIPMEELQAMMKAAREKARNTPAPTVHHGTSPVDAMEALLEFEEEGLREELQDPNTTADERARITHRLDGMQTQRRWHNLLRTVASEQSA